MEMFEILIAALALFLLGFAWYTALFGKAWQIETGVIDEKAQSGMLINHGLSFLIMCTIACGINIIVNLYAPEEPTFIYGVFHGLMFAVFYAVLAMVIH